MISARLGATIRSPVLTTLRWELGQITARAVGDITGTGCQHHCDGVIVSQLFEGAQHFANRGPAQGVSFSGRLIVIFATAPRFSTSMYFLSISMNKSFLLSSNASTRITLGFNLCQPQFIAIFFFLLPLPRRERTEVRVPSPGTTCHEGKRCASKTDDSDVRFWKQFKSKIVRLSAPPDAWRENRR